MLNNVEEIEGVRVRSTTIYYAGNQTAAIVLEGCLWDDAGNLVLNTSGNAGNAGNVGGSDE